MREAEDPGVRAIERFMAAMSRVLVECLGHDPQTVSDSPAEMIRYVTMIRDEWETPEPVPEIANEVALEMGRYLQQVTEAALSQHPQGGELVAVPVAPLDTLSDWLEVELANLDRLKGRAKP